MPGHIYKKALLFILLTLTLTAGGQLPPALHAEAADEAD